MTKGARTMSSLAHKCHTTLQKRGKRTWDQQPAGKEEMMAPTVHKTHKATAQAHTHTFYKETSSHNQQQS